MSIRTFFALPLKSRVVRRLSDHADSLCHLDPKANVLWVDSDNFHLTLCFLGEVELKLVNKIEELVVDTLSGQRSFQLSLHQLEHYQVNEDLGAVAAIANLTDELSDLRQKLVTLLHKVGVNSQQQDFKPHITLGRMEGGEVFNLSGIWPELNELAIVDSVVLYQSKQGANGSVYTPLFEIPLTSSV